MRTLTMPVSHSARAMARKCRISVTYEPQRCPIGELNCPFDLAPCWSITQNMWQKFISKEKKNEKSKA